MHALSYSYDDKHYFTDLNLVTDLGLYIVDMVELEL